MPKKKAENRALLVSITETESDVLCINIDDLHSIDAGASWKIDCHFTSSKMNKEDFETLKIGEKELSDLGACIISRLSAFYSRGES